MNNNSDSTSQNPLKNIEKTASEQSKNNNSQAQVVSKNNTRQELLENNGIQERANVKNSNIQEQSKNGSIQEQANIKKANAQAQSKSKKSATPKVAPPTVPAIKSDEKVRVTKDFITKEIIGFFADNSLWNRHDLIDKCAKKCKLSESELLDKSTGSILIKTKCMIGSVLSSMIDNKDIVVTEDKNLALDKEIYVIVKENDIEKYILEVLENDHKGFTRKQLFVMTKEKFAVTKTKSAKDDNNVQGLSGQVLSRLVKDKIIIKEKTGSYMLPKKSRYPNTEIGICLQDAYDGKDLFTCFLKAINLKGGEFFEQFSVVLLAEYFRKSNMTINSSKVTGGANDGGIDGLIETTDWLGYKERIAIQSKNRHSIAVAPKEIREFCGAVCVEKYTRGIFITTATFHKEAHKLLGKINNMIGIDGKKMFEIAIRCEVGIITEDKKQILDGKIFID